MNRLPGILVGLALLACGPPRETAAPLERPSAAAEELTAIEREGAIEVRADGELFTVFHPADPAISKPYIYPIVGPSGAAVTRGFPIEPGAGEALDHPHHTSCWFAHGDLNGSDFWWGMETRIVPGGEARVEVDGARASIRSAHRWLGADGEPVATEEREMVLGAAGGRRTIDLDLTLRPVAEPLRFGDTKEGIFALRLAPELRLEGEVARGRSLNSEGQRGGACWGKRARWITYWGPVEGEEVVGVAIFDHPENHAHPTWWHARDYGLVAANPFGRRAFEGKRAPGGELVVPVGGEQRFRYRVLLYRGAADSEVLEEAWRSWAGFTPGPDVPAPSSADSRAATGR